MALSFAFLQPCLGCTLVLPAPLHPVLPVCPCYPCCVPTASMQLLSSLLQSRLPLIHAACVFIGGKRPCCVSGQQWGNWVRGLAGRVRTPCMHARVENPCREMASANRSERLSVRESTQRQHENQWSVLGGERLVVQQRIVNCALHVYRRVRKEGANACARKHAGIMALYQPLESSTAHVASSSTSKLGHYVSARTGGMRAQDEWSTQDIIYSCR